MRRLAASLRATLGTLRHGLGIPGLYSLLLLSLLAWLTAYQQKAAYTVDVGGPLDYAYVSGFHAQESAPHFNYRWSMAHSTVKFPGIGNEPVRLLITVAGSRPNLPPPPITATVRGMVFPLQTEDGLHTDTLSVPRGDIWDGDLVVSIDVATFNEGTAEHPARDLGVTVDRITVEPAEYGLRLLVVPPLWTVAGLLVGLLLFMLTALVSTRSASAMQFLGVALGAVVTTLAVTNRPDLGLLAPQLPSLGLWCLLLAVVGRTLMDTLLDGGSHGASFVIAAGAAAFTLAFALRFGGMLYPQFKTSDLFLNVHNLVDVLHGTWIISEPLPDNTPAPYPPALYIALAPFTAILGNSEQTLALLLKWSISLLDATGCLLLAYTGSRLWRGTTGGWAALVYAVLPAAFELFSAGNYTNLFAQGTLNAAMLLGLVYLNLQKPWSVRARRLLLVIAASFLLTLLGHYGVMLAALLITGPFLIWLAVATLFRRNTAAGWALVGSLGLGVVAAFALYYRNVLDIIGNHFSHVLVRLTSGNWVVAPGVGDATASKGGLSLSKLGGKVDRLVGTVPFLLGVAGAFFLGRINSAARAWLASWLFVVCFFALLDQALGDTIRWYYLGAAALALLAGRFLSLLWHLVNTRRARLLVALLLIVMLWHLLFIWVGDLIFLRYHTP